MSPSCKLETTGKIASIINVSFFSNFFYKQLNVNLTQYPYAFVVHILLILAISRYPSSESMQTPSPRTEKNNLSLIRFMPLCTSSENRKPEIFLFLRYKKYRLHEMANTTYNVSTVTDFLFVNESPRYHIHLTHIWQKTVIIQKQAIRRQH